MPECPSYIPEDYRDKVIIADSLENLLAVGPFPEGKTLAIFPEPFDEELETMFNRLATNIVSGCLYDRFGLRNLNVVLSGGCSEIWTSDIVNENKPALEVMRSDLAAARDDNYEDEEILIVPPEYDSYKQSNAFTYHIDGNDNLRKTRFLHSYNAPYTKGARREDVKESDFGDQYFKLKSGRTGFSLGSDAFVFAATKKLGTGFVHCAPETKIGDPPRFLLRAWG